MSDKNPDLIGLKKAGNTDRDDLDPIATAMPVNDQGVAITRFDARRIREEGSAAAVQYFYPTSWPLAGGSDLTALSDDAFQASTFTDAYEPGQVAYVYVAACDDVMLSPETPNGLKGLAQDLSLPIFKISATGSEDARERLDDLNLERYASIYQAEGGYASSIGFNKWRTQTIHPRRRPKTGAPVTVGPRTIRVVLPKHLTLTAFEKRLAHMLSSSQLSKWIQTPAGLAHCQKVGCDWRIGVRMSGYNFGDADRLSRCEEIYIFRPRGRDAERLLTICETIVHEFVVRGAGHVPRKWGWVSSNQGYTSRR
ncbi:MAG: hypothetical protein Q8R85_14575 [Bosea sp. (in: a-proteobacteria)]|uniref:hypothetical protein n=1 Tax=Bosea sp. (in: a-proteobacteria) TaxID=1871050 RepID=UPI0027368B51|nr:hypothetical protein [Bosea sp. (in: a-proteobacteria)]MDP3602381.1 hypothetical protein [Bosea sp. (in: a-proteobacteria)]